MAFYLMREMAAFEIKILGTYDPAPPHPNPNRDLLMRLWQGNLVWVEFVVGFPLHC